MTGLLFKLFLNGVRYRFFKLSGYPPRPEALSIEVTQRCIARCIMCNIWNVPHHTRELSLKELTELLSSSVLNRLKELDITGGEPFLRSDLPDLLKRICDLKADHLQLLRSVAITTNGFLTERVVDRVSQIAPLLKDAGIELVIVFAMDGLGVVHDNLRRFKRGWQKLDASIQGVRAIRKTCDNVIIGLKTTVLPSNVDELERIAGYAEENGLFTIISPCIITENRYANIDLKEKLKFSSTDLQKMILFYKTVHFVWSFHRDVLLRFFEGGRMAKPCSAGFNYFFIRSTGDVYPCPLIMKRLGNFPGTSLDKIIRSPEARRFRRKILTYKECRSCTEPGLERYALPFEGFHYLRLFLKKGKRAFWELHKHMGLDKYA
ncbi:MAG: hypothetical protein H6Q52_3407 [Deltaproteobacteria bacterium]|nr:hypothetical protein [Deltaproteobacteria bacterium]